MKLDVVNIENKKIGDFEISEDVLLKDPSVHLVHELLLLQHTRPARLASTKTKSEVRGGGAKPWKQKGTGRARAGSIRSPLWKGGGVIFGPKYHEIRQPRMPRRARLKALCAALSLKQDQLIILDSLPVMTTPKTKEGASLVKAFTKEPKKILIILDQTLDSSKNLMKSVSNLEKCRVIDWHNLNVHDLFNSELTITDQAIMKNIEAWLLTRKLSKTEKPEVATK